MSSDEKPRDYVDRDPEDARAPEFSASSILREDFLKEVVRPKVLRMARQPVALKALTGLTVAGSKYFTLQNKHSSQVAKLNLDFRELAKTKLAINKLMFKEVEEPGVIPRTLAKLEEITARFNTEEQPRMEQIMDSINGNLSESQGILNKTNTSYGNLLSFVNEHSLIIKIALAIFGGGIVLTAVLIPILLIKILIFGL